MAEKLKYEIFLDKRKDGIPQPGGTFADKNNSDFYINFLLYKNNKLDDYVSTFIDTTKITIDRQLINPFFIEFGIFENIKNINNIEILFIDTFFNNGNLGIITLTPHGFKIGDEVIIDKDDKKLNKQYDGKHFIKSIESDMKFTLDIGFGDSSTLESGKITNLRIGYINPDTSLSIKSLANIYNITINS